MHLVYQLPSHPEKRDEVIDEIRKRGIGFPLTDGMRSVVASKSGNDSLLRRTLEEAERQHILRALRQTQWRVSGPRGAANMLGIKRTTLQARIRKLGIRRPV